MKTVEQHLEQLPEPYRSQALANMWWEDRDNQYATNIQALRNAFNWSRTPEKSAYWYDLETTLLDQYLADPAAADHLDKYVTTQLLRRDM